MRLKQISKRRWIARMRQGLWIPRLALEMHDIAAPEGYTFIWHPEFDFLKIVPIGEGDA